jgi:Ser-tRNA(Ala) deacylase AlaX
VAGVGLTATEQTARYLPIGVESVPCADVDTDPSPTRCKADLIARFGDPLRTVGIVRLERTAERGTWVATTGELGFARIIRIGASGQSDKRVRLAVADAAAGHRARR